jgi:hypothetical protein
MRGFRREALNRLRLQMTGMELASELVIKGALAGHRTEELPITLWPDGRDRPPHLRSFRDGWRHLRFMLMCSPTFLFLLPGLLLTLLGLSAIPGTILAGYGAFTDFFGPVFQYTASLSALGGFHLLVFGFLAKLYAQQINPIFRDPRAEKLAQFFNVDRGLILGVDFILAALAVGLPVFIQWCRTFEVPCPGLWIFAGTLFMLGVETCFAAFLVGILELQREGQRTN